jgi:hypothetical protein
MNTGTMFRIVTASDTIADVVMTGEDKLAIFFQAPDRKLNIWQECGINASFFALRFLIR